MAVDTADILTSDDEKMLRFIQKTKTNLHRMIEREILVNIIKETIDESKYFNFKSKKYERLINVNSPVFIISPVLSKISKDIKYKFSNSFGDYDFIQHLLEQEITGRFSSKLLEYVKNSNILEKLMRDEGITDTTIDIDLVHFVTSAVFSIKIDFENLVIFVTYLS